MAWTKLKRFKWNEVPLKRIDLSSRGQIGTDGFYLPLKKYDL